MLPYLITGITVVVSFICFNNRLLFDKLSLKPYRIVHAKEWYRIISHGFVHADWVHLFVNMFTFWSFGKYIEDTFRYLGFFFITLLRRDGCSFCLRCDPLP